MCGIAGFLGYGGLSPDHVSVIVSRMGDTIRHRGPDDAGIWRDDAAQVALAHRRLSIQDPSPAGHQPMQSASGRFIIVFNGEIYNHIELRRDLEKAGTSTLNSVSWRGHADTETLLAGIEVWGFEETLKRSTGMFAIALWDRQDRSLSLARDRFGEKPLYYGWQGGVFLFGSELKALKAHPAFVGKIDRDAITLQLRHNYIPAPYSIYRGIRKLLPGTVLCLKAETSAHMDELDFTKPYWSLVDAAERGKAEPFAGSTTDAVHTLDSLLRASVKSQMLADVPLGAFLSGGVDSSTIVALMQSLSRQPVKTFSIGFHEAGYNEAVYAKAVAQHLGTEHTELYVSPRDAINAIPRLPSLYDEPFSDSSQIPTFLVSEMTRQHVTVSLSGDAGDELFGGYPRYARSEKLWRLMSVVPSSCLNPAVSLIHSIPRSSWDRLSKPIEPFLPQRLRNIGDKLHKLADLCTTTDKMLFYRQVMSHWQEPETVVTAGAEPDYFLTAARELPKEVVYFESMMLTDTLTYLANDILVKIDRAAMGVSLETRVPFLDHRVVEFSWRLPLSMKVHQGEGKWILRQVLDRYVPKKLIDRPKMGFGVPIDAWLRAPLRDWAESLLDESRLRNEGFLNPQPIRQKWTEHLSGQRNWQYHLWDVLMFQSWLENEGNV